MLKIYNYNHCSAHSLNDPKHVFIKPIISYAQNKIIGSPNDLVIISNMSPLDLSSPMYNIKSRYIPF